jgi:hypothetical protein
VAFFDDGAAPVDDGAEDVEDQRLGVVTGFMP